MSAETTALSWAMTRRIIATLTAMNEGLEIDTLNDDLTHEEVTAFAAIAVGMLFGAVTDEAARQGRTINTMLQVMGRIAAAEQGEP